MKQLIQSLRNGELDIIDSPLPLVKPGHVLIQTYCSVISKGTEESLLEFGKASWLKKIKLQPDKITQIKNKLKTDGITETVAAINAKLDAPITPGYSQSGRIIEVGEGVHDFSVGDRVISNGPHADFVSVPTNLCLKIPQDKIISYEEAAFTPIAAIALQSIRLLNPSLGETVAVQGLGLIGLITVQLLKAQGCRVLGIDFDGPQLEMAKNFGAEVHSLSQEPDPCSRALSFSQGNGVDGVIIAATTDSSDPIHYAAQMCRKRGKIILVGVTGTQFSRSDFYAKELSFQVSCSYGPGRYDPRYEKQGLDYPIGFVRWTEKRNMETILELLGDKKLQFAPLISHRYDFSEALTAYSQLGQSNKVRAIVLNYPVACNTIFKSSPSQLKLVPPKIEAISIGLIGAGAHTNKIILPHLKKLKSEIRGICSQSGLSASLTAKKYRISNVYNQSLDLLNCPSINTVFISTSHNSHADLVIEAIKRHKNIFVEKPLAMNLDELKKIEDTLRAESFSRVLWVGYNRRYSPLSIKLQELFSAHPGPKQMIYTINALHLSESHWVHDPKVGGGRLLSELGHFVDTLSFLANSPMTSYQMSRMHGANNDNITLTIKFADESLGTIHYNSIGNRNYPKEKIEVFSQGKVAVIDNFRTLRAEGFKYFKKATLWSQDKGHKNCFEAFLKSITDNQPSQSKLSETFEVSRLVCLIANSSLQKTAHSFQAL